MALPVGEQLKYWGVVLVVSTLLLWFLGDVLLPFVIGAAIAYFLDPVADRLEVWGLSRGAATAVITIAAVFIFVILALAVIPTLVRQTIELFNIMPEVMQQLQAFLTERFPSIVVEDSAFRQTLAQLGETLREKGGDLLRTALSSAASLVNIVVLFIIAPVVAVYLLLDWDKMIAQIDELLPRDHAPTIRQLAREVDKTLAGFVRGMGSVCLILGTYYAIALMAVGLQFGLVVGVVAGMLTFIPYLGALIGGALAIGLAVFQFWGEWGWILVVAAIFQAGQILEGNVITPKLVGSSVGLHPVWLLLALSVFGSLFGLVGMLVAVPVAAAIGVLVRFAFRQYRSGLLYRGQTALQNVLEEEQK